jgi:hypothetical protein
MKNSITSKKIKIGFYIFSLLFLGLMLLFISFYFISIYKINSAYYLEYNSEAPVALRKFPYPYRAAMAISSDIDNTETLEEFIEIQKFLHTDEITSMGRGIDLEIGGSFFFFEPPRDAISYFQGGAEVARTIRKHIRSGHIDFMHSYGKKPDFTRRDAIKSIQELDNDNLKIDVWVDHTKTIDNLGDDRTFGLGDHPGSNQYHADLTLEYGIKYAWLGKGTMITGQAVPFTMGSLVDIFNPDHPFDSLVNISKVSAKNVLAVYGNKKYALHKDNDLARITTLDDGQKVYEFIRFDNYWQGVSLGADSKGLGYVISKKTLNRLKDVGGYIVVYTHLGRNLDCSEYICKETKNALRNLAQEYRAGNIYVTTTSKLLNYYTNSKYLNWSYESKDGRIFINIHNVKDEIFGIFVPTVKDLQGITFYIPKKSKVSILINGAEIEGIQRNATDYTDRESVTIPVTFLKYSLQ